MNCVPLPFALMVIIQLVVASKNSNRTKIYIGGLFGGRRKMTKTVELALNDVNANDNILTDYELELFPQIIPGTTVSIPLVFVTDQSTSKFVYSDCNKILK